MAVNFTEEQKQVIELRNRNILVSAAAGSGKTAVLVERIITRLTKDNPPIDIDKLLIVTYTEAAAAEMKERIQNAIQKALESEPENVHLQKQATLIHQASITTIHGFCMSVIREYFHTIDLEPGLRVAEEGELKLLKHDVAEELIENHYAEAEADFLEFVESYASGKDDRKLEEIILQLYEFSRSYPNPKAWLASCAENYEVKELEQMPFVQDILRETKTFLAEWQEELAYAIEVCEMEDGPIIYRDTLSIDRRLLSEIGESETFGEMQRALRGMKWERLKANRDKNVSSDKLELVKAVRDGIKDAVKKLTEQYYFDDVAVMQQDMELAQNNIRVITQLTDEFADLFAEKKRSKAIMDFSDMERYALEILTREEDGQRVPTAVAEELQEKFEEVMIDEYQDSNLIQEAILMSVSGISKGNYNVFMVGDVKQSIYRFRLSRPELFMEKYNTYSTTESKTQRIDLHKNFRSRGEVLDSTNYVFERIMMREFGGIEYDDAAALYVGAAYEKMLGNDTELLVIETAELQKQEKREAEARAVARRIKELLSTHQVLDKQTGAYRGASFKDMVILTRSLVGWADTFAEILGKEGIPTYTNSKEGYFQTREIKLLLDYLRVLDNPRQDIPLAAVLVSIFAGVTSEELALIKSETEGKLLFDHIRAYADSGENKKLREKLCVFLNTLEKFRAEVPYTAIHVLLWKILEETGYQDYVAALPGGVQRAANLEMLLEKAIAFEGTSYKGLFNFVRYIEQLHKYDVDYGEAVIADENVDVVTLMSIHKSKGLEFPIVFVVGTGKSFNTMDIKGNIVIHADLGIGLDAIDVERRTKTPTLLKKAIQRRLLLETKAEELRVLYVAMTRAKEKLIMTGAVKNFEETTGKWSRLERREETFLPYGVLTNANCYLDWLLPSMQKRAGETKLQLRLINVFELTEKEVEEHVEQFVTKEILRSWDTDRIYDEAMKEQLREQFAYRYPFEDSQNMKQKMSVSELKKRMYAEEEGEELFKEEEVIPLLPSFMREKEQLTGATRGTAYHRFLELLDFTKDYTADALAGKLTEDTEAGLMDREMAESIRITDVLRLLQSDIGKRLQKAEQNHTLIKEQPFVFGIPAKEIYKGETSEEIILIQGIIDVYFEEDGELVLLDYKTDRVSHASELTERYRAQLNYYTEALERLTGKRVKQKIIYSFTLQKEIEV